jgi:hypothetical protein
VAEIVYLLCTCTSAACAVLLLRQHRSVRAREGRGALLIWSTVCFTGLALANVVLFVDLVLYPGVDMSLLRAGLGAVATLAFVIGLVWELK